MSNPPNPTPPPTPANQLPPEEGGVGRPSKAERIAASVRRGPASHLVTLPAVSLTPLDESEQRNLSAILDLLTVRIEQIARLSEEQWSRVQGVLETMLATMEVMEIVIGQADQQNEVLTQYVERLGIATSVLLKLNEEMQEFLAYQEEQEEGYQPNQPSSTTGG